MKALLLTKQKSLTIVERPMPTPDEGEVLVRVAAAALCRTDAKMWHSGHRDLHMPRILGHEVSGFIDASPGRLYVIWPGKACGSCHACRSGRENLCPDMRITGFHRDGGFAEFLAVPRSSLLEVPDGVGASMAALSEPLACAVHGVRQASVNSCDQVLIYGAGTLGILLALVCLDCGATVVIADPDEDKLSKSTAFRSGFGVGTDLHLSGADGLVDVVFNATPAAETFDAGVHRLAAGGRFCLFSGIGNLPVIPSRIFDELHYRELKFVGAYGCTRNDMSEAVRLLSCYADDLQFLIERRIRLDEVPSEMEAILVGKGFRRIIA
ncbi:MAG: alcohol dehydrogenase catalytic domain-containing protein [Candidatus Chlorobium antarcticum]|nr:alcohol dehydrogenase catalytic domain-containing protein [Candidatus Chlorobium antarcticum]